MATKEKKSTSFKKITKKNQGRIYDGIMKNYNQVVESGKNLSQESLEKINTATASGTEFIKSQPYWKSLKSNSLKIKEKGLEQGAMLKNDSPKLYKKIVIT